MSAPALTTYTHRHWCDRCRRTIRVTVSMQTARPAESYWGRRWDEAGRRDGEAAFQERHAATCGRPGAEHEERMP
mgnify:FL=1